MKTAFILCSRSDSTRVPGKPFRRINGKPILQHLIERLAKTKIPVILVVPPAQAMQYDNLKIKDVHTIYVGSESDPLNRMYSAAKDLGVKNIIRVTHDKIFVEPDVVLEALDQYHQMNLDYLYSSQFTEGSGFEIISFETLKTAATKYKNVEHISYAIRAITENKHDFQVPRQYRSDIRLLIDYPKDIQLLNTIFASLKSDCSLTDVIELMDHNPWMRDINKLPPLTLYTCVFNGEKFIERAMQSISKQKGFRDWEYIIVDDASTDKTAHLVSKFAAQYQNVTWIRNESNMGLASSSNVALKNATGKYIMRLDADDFFVSDTACREMLNAIRRRNLDVIYPNNYFGTMGIVQNGKDAHHVGGSIFSTRAINHIKFTDGLRGYEGLDLFERARLQLKIGYLNRPIFFYTQHATSMSKTNLKEREEIKRAILAGELRQ